MFCSKLCSCRRVIRSQLRLWPGTKHLTGKVSLFEEGKASRAVTRPTPRPPAKTRRTSSAAKQRSRLPDCGSQARICRAVPGLMNRRATDLSSLRAVDGCLRSPDIVIVCAGEMRSAFVGESRWLTLCPTGRIKAVQAARGLNLLTTAKEVSKLHTGRKRR